jgi:hypothetical protein
MIQVNQELLDKMPPEDQAAALARVEQLKKAEEEKEAQAAKAKEEAYLRKYPTLRSIFDRKSVANSGHLKQAVLKRIHICLTYLRTPDVESVRELKDDQITVDLAVSILGRTQATNMMIEDIGKILQDACGYSVLRIFPREMIELREHCKKQAALAEKLLWSVTLQMVKKEGMYEPKAKVPAGEPVSG